MKHLLLGCDCDVDCDVACDVDVDVVDPLCGRTVNCVCAGGAVEDPLLAVA